jgi:hypothetical protein
VQILKVAAEFHSFACRWYVSLSSWVTLLLAPPFWFVVQFVLSVDTGGVEEDALGTGAELDGALGEGLAEAGELGSAVGDELAGGVADALRTRLRRALCDGLDDADGLGDDTKPDCAAQWTRTVFAGHSGTLADTPVSVPDARQP